MRSATTRSTSTAAHARSAIRSARPARASSSRCWARCARPAAGAASRRCASAAARRRRWRSSACDAMSGVPMPTWLVFCVACVALALTPGPNMLLLVSRTLAQGRRAGVLTLAGTQTGLAFHVAAVACGLAALLAAVPVAYDALRVAGALYLAWLAWQTWNERGDPARVAAPRIPAARLYRDGALTGILNPKVALFELALFPQ